MRPYSGLSVSLIWLTASLTSILCSTTQNCKIEGQRIPDSNNPTKFHLCHFFKKTSSWHSYPFHCSSDLVFDSITQDCVKNLSPDNAKSDLPGKKEIHHSSVSNVPIFNGIARLIRSASGFPVKRQDGMENSEIILSLASSIKSLAMTVEKLANAQIQKSSPCLLPSPEPTPAQLLPAEPVTTQPTLQRLPIYEIFRPVYDNDVNAQPNVHAQVTEINNLHTDETKRLGVNSAVETVDIQKVPIEPASATPTTVYETPIPTEVVTEVSSTTVSTTPESKATTTPTISTTAATVSASTSSPSNEDYSASEEHDRVPPSNQKFPAPGNNLFDFLFNNLFKRPVNQRRPVPYPNMHKNRLPPLFLDHRFESSTARNAFRPPQSQPSYPIRIPLLQQTNSPKPHHAFPMVEQHVLPGGGKLVNLVSLFNHLSGIGTPVDVTSIGHDDEDSDHFIPVPEPVRHSVSSSTSPKTPSLPSSTVKVQSEEFPQSVSANIDPTILSTKTDAEEDNNNSSRLNDRKPRM